MITDPRTVEKQAPEPETRALCHLARLITLAPWTLGAHDLAQARTAGLRDEAILQVVLLAAFFGHLNRIADAVGIELDYRVHNHPPPADPHTPPYARPAPSSFVDTRASRGLDLSLRPGIAELLETWQSYALQRDEPIDRRQRAIIANAVAQRLGDGETLHVAQPESRSPLDAALIITSDEITLAPWRLGATTIERLRTAGLTEDTAIFDAIATATACTTFSRIRVALAALSSSPLPAQ